MTGAPVATDPARSGRGAVTGRLGRRIVAGAALALTASLVVGMLLTFELVLVNERSALDRSLRRQRDHLERDVASRLAAEPLAADRDQQVADAVADFLALDPPMSAYVTVVLVGDRRVVSDGAPPELDALARGGGLDDVPMELLATRHTPAGDLRALGAPLLDGSRRLGEVVVAGPLDPARSEAFAALRRLAAAGLVGLAAGVVLVVLAVRRVLHPLAELAGTAAAVGPSRAASGSRVAVRGDDEVADLAREFNAMLDRLDEAAAERERLLATISHELRTPLAVASGTVELARRTRAAAADPNVAAALAVTQAELARTTRLVGDLLALGRSGHAGFLQRRRTTLAAVARELELRVDGLGLDTVTVAPGSDEPVDLDTERLLQALLNCVQNAVEHNAAGTTVDVTLEVVHDGDRREVVVAVADDGAGIPEADRSRVFTPFVRLPSAADAARGTGLGLAVVAAVAEAHGGRATIHDARAGQTPGGTGLTVELRFPADAS